MTYGPTVSTSAGPIALTGQRVLVSGALNLSPLVRSLEAGGAEVIASDADPAALAAAFAGTRSVRCLAADLDLTLDVRRLAVTVQRLGGCGIAVHHMGGDGGGTPEFAAIAFLRAMRLIHAMRPRMRPIPGSRLVLTGCPAACAASMAIVLKRAGDFCTRTGPAITCCAPDDLPDLLGTGGLAVRARVAAGAVALAG